VDGGKKDECAGILFVYGCRGERGDRRREAQPEREKRGAGEGEAGYYADEFIAAMQPFAPFSM